MIHNVNNGIACLFTILIYLLKAEIFFRGFFEEMRHVSTIICYFCSYNGCRLSWKKPF